VKRKNGTGWMQDNAVLRSVVLVQHQLMGAGLPRLMKKLVGGVFANLSRGRYALPLQPTP
jgi:hypothetical protein